MSIFKYISPDQYIKMSTKSTASAKSKKSTAVPRRAKAPTQAPAQVPVPAPAQAPAPVDHEKILIGLMTFFVSAGKSSKDIIQYLEFYHIPVDVYLLDPNMNIKIPLIYYACRDDRFTELFGYLLNKGVNLNVNIISQNPLHQIELLYYCHDRYIPILVSRGCRLDPNKVATSIERILIGGTITKLMSLYKHGALLKEQLIGVLQNHGLIFRILDRLYERIFELSQRETDPLRFKTQYDLILKHYVKTFKLFFINGIGINQVENGESFTQKVLNTYFVPLIQYIVSLQKSLETEDLLHYSNFEINNRQVMSLIYNDETYKQISEIIKGKIRPKRINVKKTHIKKNIPIKQP
jgi:hypothetical protein